MQNATSSYYSPVVRSLDSLSGGYMLILSSQAIFLLNSSENLLDHLINNLTLSLLTI